MTAENLRKIGKDIPIIGSIGAKKDEIERVELKRKNVFKNATKPTIETELRTIYTRYCNKTSTNETFTELISDSLVAVQLKISQQSTEQKRYSSFLELSKLGIKKNLSDIKLSAARLGESANPLIIEKLTVLKAAASYSGKNREDQIACPACGRSISSTLFASHIKAEEVSLNEVIKNFNSHKNNIGNLCDNLQSLKRIASQDQLKDWKAKQNHEVIGYIESLKIESIRNSCTSEIQAEIESKLISIIDEAKKEVVNPLIGVDALLKDNMECIQLLLM